ncbi:MAG: helix-turn-helix domain-containing protein [Alcanivorax sp.]|nr:helix-turn-helix domain-containing protein [Alcanivorax sp.]
MDRWTMCRECRLRGVCLPATLTTEQVEQFNHIVRRGTSFERSQYIYHVDSAFRSLYLVRSGAIKTGILSNEGIEQITGFYLPGDLFGIDGLGYAGHGCSAQALEHANICEIPFDQLEELTLRFPPLRKHFFSLLSKQIREEQKLHMLLSTKSADIRVAALLLSFVQRQRQLGLRSDNFRLPMSRHDLANYLGLVVETVSRVLTRFHHSGILTTEGREIFITDEQGLKAQTHGMLSPEEPPPTTRCNGADQPERIPLTDADQRAPAK